MRNHVFSALLFAAPVLALGQFNYDAKILDYKGLKFPCEGSVVPKLLIRNDGTVAMSGCVVETWKNGVLVNSFDWQLAIPSVPGESRQPVFPVVPDVEPNDELEFKIKTVNTVPDQNADGNEKLVLLDDPFAATSAAVIEVKIATDGAPGELTWEIRDAGGTLIASGGPYEDANTLISEFVALGSSACYEFKGQDNGRDVLSGAGMQVVANGNTLFSYNGSELTAGATKGIGTGNGAACTNALEIALRTDGQPQETTWNIVRLTDGATVCAGSGALTANADVVESCCLVDGCYRLAVTDLGGDGILGGGYALRLQDGRRILDNTGNFNTGSYSAMAGEQGFCLPLGTAKPIFSSCDKLDWLPNRFIVAAAEPDVTAQYGASNTTSGYEFWFFDPNGTYSFRRFRSHATSDGYGSGATRACHFKINGWINSALTPHLPQNTLLNVRIRGRVAGGYQEFGPACRFKIDAALAACPQVKLQNDPANSSDYSCGVVREFGGSNRSANRLVAAPPQFFPAVMSSSVRYQFRFRAGAFCVVRPPQTSPTLYLNWSNAPALTCGTTYQVDVRVSKDGGTTWCTGSAVADAATNCSDPAAWGLVCSVSIAGCPQQVVAATEQLRGNTAFSLFPNPVLDGRFMLAFGSMDESIPVELELMDLAGRRVWWQRSSLPEGSSVLHVEVDAALSPGVHFLSVRTADGAHTERLVIGQ